MLEKLNWLQTLRSGSTDHTSLPSESSADCMLFQIYTVKHEKEMPNNTEHGVLYTPEVNRGLVSYQWYEVATPTFISQVAESKLPSYGPIAYEHSEVVNVSCYSIHCTVMLYIYIHVPPCIPWGRSGDCLLEPY